MIKRFIGTCVAAVALAVTGKMVSDYAENKTEPEKCKKQAQENWQRFHGRL